MAITVKQIKPKKLNTPAMQKAIAAEMKAFGKDMKKEFEKTTRTWEHKVVFERLEEISPDLGKVEVAVLTDDEIYRYVDEGTKGPYKIPKFVTPGKRLAFRTGKYGAKTSPGVISSSAGSQPSGPWTRPQQVTHPGIKAREFDKTIQAYMEPRFRRRMETAMKKAAAASGHKI